MEMTSEVKRGATAVTRRGKKQQHHRFSAACASEIMAKSTNLRLKILDANSVSRIFTDPTFAGMELTFYRCSL